MSAHKFDEDRAELISDFNNKTVLISFDVENNASVFKDACSRVALFNFLRVFPMRLGYFVLPGKQVLLGIVVLGPKLLQCFKRNNSHVVHGFGI